MPSLSNVYDWSDYVKNYSADVLEQHHRRLMPEVTYLGVELEQHYNVATRSEFDRVAGNILNYFNNKTTKAILKSDSSIEDHDESGAELVTTPELFETLINDFTNFWENNPKVVAHDSCGMHVHVSRKNLRRLDIGKLMMFINMPDNSTPIVDIAGRYGVSYAQYTQKVLTDVLTSSDKYEVLNLGKSSTIEFRLFATPKNYEEFRRRLEFVQSSLAFAKQTTIAKLSWKDYSEFLTRNSSDYPELTAFLTTNRHI